jgi:hypothetical protein
MTNVKPAPLYPFKESPSQTAGPYVHIGLTPNFCGIEGVYDQDLGIAMVTDKTKGERITVEGRVFDGAGTPLKDVLVEIWQADSDGLYNSPAEQRGTADPAFTGWGRCAADQTTAMANFMPLSDAVAQNLKSGDTVAFEGFTHLIPHASAHEAIRQDVKDLTLVRMTPDVIYDQLIGMGMVAS